jgi:hypothetical protein
MKLPSNTQFIEKISVSVKPILIALEVLNDYACNDMLLHETCSPIVAGTYLFIVYLKKLSLAQTI